ncbi:trimeric intracellular cation channel family protein [Rhodococcus zopfii]|uniref:trimeric intracellular cation channel family protein n=1 Tax=Rhodococcus zopfii TaxID=43772 RepID=UPI000934405D|nr:trimeric intracellular cation channel family protein [Rhodococcus zopfii]
MLLKILELVGIVAFAMSGALVGVVKRLDLFGVCLVGVFTAVGGGIVRDLLLDIHPPTSLSSWRILGTALGASLLVFFLHRAVSKLTREILILDALGMGLFATTGATIALDAGARPLAAALIGATAAIGGGILRDVLVNEVPLLLQRDLYAIPALLGAAVLVAAHELGLGQNLSLVLGTVLATGLRLLALWRGWSLPQPRLPRED